MGTSTWHLVRGGLGLNNSTCNYTLVLRQLRLRVLEHLLVELELAAEDLLVDGPGPRSRDGEIAKHEDVHGRELVVVGVLLDDGEREALGARVLEVKDDGG